MAAAAITALPSTLKEQANKLLASAKSTYASSSAYLSDKSAQVSKVGPVAGAATSCVQPPLACLLAAELV